MPPPAGKRPALKHPSFSFGEDRQLRAHLSRREDPAEFQVRPDFQGPTPSLIARFSSFNNETPLQPPFLPNPILQSPFSRAHRPTLSSSPPWPPRVRRRQCGAHVAGCSAAAVRRRNVRLRLRNGCPGPAPPAPARPPCSVRP